MEINWFTVIAQVINFFILVWLLTRFLYKPVLNAIDERESKIASQLTEAEAKKAEAEREKDEYLHRNRRFEHQKQELMDSVLKEAKELKHKLFEEARSEAIALRTKLEAAFKEMQENSNNEIVQKTQQEVFAIARKALTDLSSVSLEEQATNIFVDKLINLEEEERKRFTEACETVDTPLLVQSAFELPQYSQDAITSAVREVLGGQTDVQFKTSAKIINGIELTTNGYKLAWSISEYLNALESTIYREVQ